MAGLGLWSFNVVKRSEAKSTLERICQTVAENYFDTTRNLGSWFRRCVTGSAEVLGACPSVDGYCVSSALNQSFMELESSHLFVSVPTASKLYYHHESHSNGLMLQWIEGSLVVIGVHPQSPADGVDIRLGDVLKARDGEPLRSLSQALGSGEFTLERNGKKHRVQLTTGPFQINHVPKLSPLTSQVALLKLSSFEGSYQGEDLFNKESVRALAQDLAPYRGVVIDLRGNLGGNFVALLRALSPLMCQASHVGVLQKMGASPNHILELPDSLEFQDQWEVIEKAEAVELRTFPGYGCYQGRVVLLVDSLTSSVAEIFAHYLQQERGAKVLGQMTAGAVLVALREELLDLGEDFYLNMPILTYLDSEGQPLEAVGVVPDQELRYDLNSFRRGVDNWEEAALKLLE